MNEKIGTTEKHKLIEMGITIAILLFMLFALFGNALKSIFE
jgi:hypothetical protein